MHFSLVVRIVCMIPESVPRQICEIENLWPFFDATLSPFPHSLHACTQRRSMCLIISDSDIAGMNML